MVFGLETAIFAVYICSQFIKLDHLSCSFKFSHLVFLCFLFVILELAIAVLWIEFVREVRWCWEESQPLPRMPTNGSIDLSTCLINQKLHMVTLGENIHSLSFTYNV